MPERAQARLSDLLGETPILALVGLAKNTGKTQTLSAILDEYAAAQVRVGVTSIGRDGEDHDVIDARIDKPPLHLREGSLLATTGALLRKSALAHERLLQTGMRTPLGEVVVARLAQSGNVEVAGPSASADVRIVSDAMRQLGAERVLIDGAIDRRAASSPDVADGLLIATGAVLGSDMAEVVQATAEAVELVKLPLATASSAGADSSSESNAASGAGSREQAAQAEEIVVERRLVLGGEPAEVAALLREAPRARTLRVQGALGERFLDGLLSARLERAGRELLLVVGDPTKVFLVRHPPSWYRRQGLAIAVERTIELKAITVNPLAPQSHRFDSRSLRELISAAIADVPVLDVLDPSYAGARAGARS